MLPRKPKRQPPPTTITKPQTQTSPRTKGQDNSGWVAARSLPKDRALRFRSGAAPERMGGLRAARRPKHVARFPRLLRSLGWRGSTFCLLWEIPRWGKDVCGSGCPELPVRSGKSRWLKAARACSTSQCSTGADGAMAKP